AARFAGGHALPRAWAGDSRWAVEAERVPGAPRAPRAAGAGGGEQGRGDAARDRSPRVYRHARVHAPGRRAVDPGDLDQAGEGEAALAARRSLRHPSAAGRNDWYSTHAPMRKKPIPAARVM